MRLGVRCTHVSDFQKGEAFWPLVKRLRVNGAPTFIKPLLPQHLYLKTLDTMLRMEHPIHKVQEIPFDHPESSCMFRNKLFATPGAIAMYRNSIHHCLEKVQKLAKEHNGADYLQTFDDPDKPEGLWIIENEDGVFAMLPSEY